MGSCTSTDNRRHAKRFHAQHPAKIVFGPESMISCTVRDISTGGARIAVMPHMPLPQNFELFIAAHDLQVRQARVCWRKGGFAGIAFSSDEADAAMTVEAPRPLTFEDCLDQAAMPAHLAAKPARKNLKLWQTSI